MGADEIEPKDVSWSLDLERLALARENAGQKASAFFIRPSSKKPFSELKASAPDTRARRIEAARCQTVSISLRRSHL